MRRLIAAIVQGIGWSAGQDIYQEAKTKVREELARQRKADKALARAARGAEKARRAAEKQRAASIKKREKTLERELAALKRRMGQ